MHSTLLPSEQAEDKISVIVLYHFFLVSLLVSNSLRRYMFSSGTDAKALSGAVKLACTLLLTNFKNIHKCKDQ